MTIDDVRCIIIQFLKTRIGFFEFSLQEASSSKVKIILPNKAILFLEICIEKKPSYTYEDCTAIFALIVDQFFGSVKVI